MTQIRDVASRDVASREVAIERLDGPARTAARDQVVVEAALELRARGVPVATVMRTPGHDLELVRGLLHAEGLAGAARQVDAGAGAADAVDIDLDPDAFAGRGLLASAACGVCGRVAIADLERRAREVAADTVIDRAVIARLPPALRAAQSVFAATGGLHGAGLTRLDGTLVGGVKETIAQALDDQSDFVGRKSRACQCSAEGDSKQGFELFFHECLLNFWL